MLFLTRGPPPVSFVVPKKIFHVTIVLRFIRLAVPRLFLSFSRLVLNLTYLNVFHSVPIAMLRNLDFFFKLVHETQTGKTITVRHVCKQAANRNRKSRSIARI